MTGVISVQHSRNGSGATAIALTLAYRLSLIGRTLYVECDFLNPVIEQFIPSRELIHRWSNDWIIGEALLNDSCISLERRLGSSFKNFYVLPANASEDARIRMENLDAERDDRILKTLEKENWVVEGRPLDYVVIDTPSWMHYVPIAVSYVSNYVIYVLKPSMYELSIFEDKIERIYSNFISIIRPFINMYNPESESDKRFEKIFRERVGIEPVKIPYMQEMTSGISLERIFSKDNKLQDYLIEIVNEAAGRTVASNKHLYDESITLF